MRKTHQLIYEAESYTFLLPNSDYFKSELICIYENAFSEIELRIMSSEEIIAQFGTKEFQDITKALQP